MSRHASSVDHAVFQLSWLFGTVVNYHLGQRNNYDQIHEQPYPIFLGSILLDHPDVSNNTTYKEFTLSNFLASTQTKKENLHIIQVLEAFEQEQNVPASALKAIPKQNAYGIAVHQLTLRDFTHEMIANDTFIDDFKGVYDSLEKQSPGALYIHCKAGVNRSFRVAAALVTLLKLKKASGPPSVYDVVKEALITCLSIKRIRPCITFDKKFVKQLSFIVSVVTKILEIHPLDFEKTFLATTTRLLLELYITERKQQKESFSLFTSKACAKKTKLEAARKLLQNLIKNNTSPHYTEDEITALTEGKLGDIVMLLTQHTGLKDRYYPSALMSSHQLSA